MYFCGKLCIVPFLSLTDCLVIIQIYSVGTKNNVSVEALSVCEVSCAVAVMNCLNAIVPFRGVS